MKKILLCIGMCILLTGCGGTTEEVKCTIGGKPANFTLKNGLITKYNFDEIETSQNIIDEINGEYFTSATNNEEGKEALNRYIESVNGSCEL